MTDICPECGASGVPLMFGLPVPQARHAAAAGDLALGGCVRPVEPPDWQCVREHRWRGGDQVLWDARLLAALTRHGYHDDS